MRFRVFSVAQVCRRSTIPGAFLCLLMVLLAGCGGGAKETPPVKVVDLAVAGQTVTKARTAGNEVVLLEERLTSIFEDGPQRTLAILQGDNHTVQPYTPPAGWSVIDFALHPSGDISVVLTTTRDVRIVRLEPHRSLRSD